MSRLYLHEIVDVTPGREEQYMTSELSFQERVRWTEREPPPPRGTRRPIDVGKFRSTEVSGRWPKILQIHGDRTWDASVDAYQKQFEGDSSTLESWWQRNTDLRRGGYDRIAIPAPFSPSIDDLMKDGVKGRVFFHAVEWVRWGQATEYLIKLGQLFLPAAEEYGWKIVGAYRVGFRPRQVIQLWSMGRWQNLADLLSATGNTALDEWTSYREQTVVRAEEMVLLPGRVNALHQEAE